MRKKYECVHLMTKLTHASFAYSQFEPLEKIRVQEKIPKVDVNSIRKYATERAHEMSAERVAYLIDFLKTYQSIWSKRLSSEIANGMTNLIYAIMSANATTVHIENAVVRGN